MNTQKGLDAAIRYFNEDQYGYGVLAESLDNSILLLDNKESAVIGIEGAWGTGKTSLLNLLLIALKDKALKNTFTLNTSPRLSGDSVTPVESLLLPVAAIIEEEERKRLTPEKGISREKEKKISGTAKRLFNYTQATRRIFEILSSAIKENNLNFQIIVLEHVDSSIWGQVDNTHEAACWKDERDGLIPQKWIR